MHGTRGDIEAHWTRDTRGNHRQHPQGDGQHTEAERPGIGNFVVHEAPPRGFENRTTTRIVDCRRCKANGRPPPESTPSAADAYPQTTLVRKWSRDRQYGHITPAQPAGPVGARRFVPFAVLSAGRGLDPAVTDNIRQPRVCATTLPPQTHADRPHRVRAAPGPA